MPVVQLDNTKFHMYREAYAMMRYEWPNWTNGSMLVSDAHMKVQHLIDLSQLSRHAQLNAGAAHFANFIDHLIAAKGAHWMDNAKKSFILI
jgi:hypothetical protein